MTRPSWWRSPRAVWSSSLPLRVVASTLAFSLAVLVLGGLLLLRQAIDGMMDAKRETSAVQASLTLNQMQEQLSDPSLNTAAALYERLNQVADQVGSRGGQYIVIEGTLSGLRSSGISDESVPSDLRRVVGTADGMWITPTTVQYSSVRDAEPGLAIGATLEVRITGDRIPTYLIFPLTTEVATLHALEQAIYSVGLLLLFALAMIAYLVSQQVVRPVRLASQAASRLASGRLNERLSVRGTDDLASLATSMNNMASELQQHIGRLEHLSQVQQRFVSDVSHELRTPLTTVKMASEMLYDSRENFGTSSARSAELLHAELGRFEELLDDLLEISRFDAGAATLTLEETDLASLVASELDIYRPMAERLGTELRFTSDGPAIAELDPRRIRRIVRNLITNAIEHGECLPINVHVASDAHAVAVTVRDYGVGFLPSQASRVFDRFWRADPSRTRSLGGTGLGLSIAREDAHLHQGWLAAWGRPKSGAQFRLTLPKRPGIALHGSPLPLIPTDLPTPMEIDR